MAADYRKIPIPTWMGYSIGHWDGDTLVVTTAGYNDRTTLDLGGHPHTEALRVTERFHRRDVGHIDLQVTLDDPKAYTRSWTLPVELNLVPDGELIEYICENERDAPHLVGKSGEEFRVPAEVLAQYAGTYGSGHRGLSGRAPLYDQHQWWGQDPANCPLGKQLHYGRNRCGVRQGFKWRSHRNDPALGGGRSVLRTREVVKWVYIWNVVGPNRHLKPCGYDHYD